MILGVTGHRPERLGGYGQVVRDRLEQLAFNYLNYLQPPLVISGMALGWDQAVCRACVHIGLQFLAAVPCADQSSRWRLDDKREYDRLLGLAHKVEYVSEGPYSPECMTKRNHWIVDHCSGLLALWDGTPKGGTAECIAYAMRIGRAWDNLWPAWITLRSAQSTIRK